MLNKLYQYNNRYVCVCIHLSVKLLKGFYHNKYLRVPIKINILDQKLLCLTLCGSFRHSETSLGHDV